MENNKIGSLAEMTNESFLNRPEQSIEATEEYLLNLSEEHPDKANKIKELLKDDNYSVQFHTAITHTSLMVFIMSILATTQNTENEIELNFNDYLKEFVSSSIKDDQFMYSMRMFYLNGLTGRELGFGQINSSDFSTKEELDIAQKISSKQLQRYDELLGQLKKAYLDSKNHQI